MNVILRPNAGQHQITVESAQLKSPEAVDKYIVYLRQIRKILWDAELARKQ